MTLDERVQVGQVSGLGVLIEQGGQLLFGQGDAPCLEQGAGGLEARFRRGGTGLGFTQALAGQRQIQLAASAGAHLAFHQRKKALRLFKPLVGIAGDQRLFRYCVQQAAGDAAGLPGQIGLLRLAQLAEAVGQPAIDLALIEAFERQGEAGFEVHHAFAAGDLAVFVVERQRAVAQQGVTGCAGIPLQRIIGFGQGAFRLVLQDGTAPVAHRVGPAKPGQQRCGQQQGQSEFHGPLLEDVVGQCMGSS